jgi:hypothetical protein
MANPQKYNWTAKEWSAFYKKQNPTWSAAKIKTSATNAVAKMAAEKKDNPTVALTDSQIIASLETNHPQWAQWVLSVPELKKTVIEWAKIPGGPTQDQIDAAVYPTKIVQDWNAIQVSLSKLQALAPGEYKKRVDTATAAVDDVIAQKGVTVTADNRQKLIDAALNNAWQVNSLELDKAVGAYFDIKTAKIGEATNIIDELRSLAAKYMIPMSPGTLDEMGKSIAAGLSTAKDQEAWFKQQAASLYPFMAGTMDTTPPSIWFGPLKQLISTNLDIPVTSIDFNEPSGKWMNLAVVRDPDTGANVARSNSGAIKELRTNVVYGYDSTPGGIQAAFDIGTQIRSMMGFGA